MYTRVLAYHLTWGTYGTRLHGDRRGTVDRDHNAYGEPVLDFDQHRWSYEANEAKFPPVVLDAPMMQRIEAIVPDACARGGWDLHTCAAGPDHVHVLLDANGKADPKDVRRMLKRWVGQSLDEQFLRIGATWWAECGSAKYVFDPQYLHNAFDYVKRQRATSP